ncbi:hypothetical protein F5Y13DRAFT_154654 [Hypoxylon sp. FL1857]|nr:hypothetical protein F5Y13DRAFT_154654 [Hypoxylon sp. FL1857]
MAPIQQRGIRLPVRQPPQQPTQQPTPPSDQSSCPASERSDNGATVNGNRFGNFSNTLPNGLPLGLPEDLPGVLLDDLLDDLPDGFSNEILNDLRNDLPNDIPNGLPNELPKGHIPPGQTPAQVSQIPTPTGASICEHVDFSRAIQVLDAAREAPGAMRDPYIRSTLEKALREVWRRLAEDPTEYIMSRDEFAVFNFFQYLYDDDTRRKLAAKARANYWDNTFGTRPARRNSAPRRRRGRSA